MDNMEAQARDFSFASPAEMLASESYLDELQGTEMNTSSCRGCLTTLESWALDLEGPAP